MKLALKVYPRMTFSISIKGDIEINYRIEQKDSLEVFEVYGMVSYPRSKNKTSGGK